VCCYFLCNGSPLSFVKKKKRKKEKKKRTETDRCGKPAASPGSQELEESPKNTSPHPVALLSPQNLSLAMFLNNLSGG
jgi:hypothetical protein